MDVAIRPEAEVVFFHLLTGLIIVLIVSFLVFTVALVLCYLASLVCRCFSTWPAADRATLVAKTAVIATIVVLLSIAVLESDVLVGINAILGILAVLITLFYALCTTPRTVRTFQRDSAVFDRIKAQQYFS